MIVGLDSAYAPTLAQAQAARAAGVKLWGGYLQSRPRVGLLNGWIPAQFAAVRQAGITPLAFCSGWDDPVVLRNLAAHLGVRLCLDVESGIRDDGPWVDGFIAASGAGLYGLNSVQYHAAPFRVVANYPGTSDPGVTWPGGKGGPPPEPHGWQWQNSHMEFGIEVDRGNYDDWFYTEGGAVLDPATDQAAFDAMVAANPLLAQMAARSVREENDFNALIYRIKTILDNAPTVEGGPTVGEVNQLKTALDAILAKPSGTTPHTHTVPGTVTGTST